MTPDPNIQQDILAAHRLPDVYEIITSAVPQP